MVMKNIDWCFRVSLPAFVLGMYWRKARAMPLTLGMLFGLAMAVLIQFVLAPLGIIPAVSAGLMGFMIDLALERSVVRKLSVIVIHY